ncbi:CBS domain-containing protein [Pseudorhodoplanes sinuspersici]|uniref:Inosine-5-monophosphate dehydrogenase n=1 Tax=Pseudorhodoplanes sinuspersici TaxID=1235591 RepID=A0A1W6ZZL5_9HYPH|nr:CBS domain-containing protein [Pseudorhodoplanes sinuspersici]ARQ02571.1 inosine-5-monophosphate dehydrogenase [Pseudorhodoplanes sinuspersici]RKE74422.1 IMP dehydrogenase [Pseudorhodoplanes sinuspersici]
MEVSEVMTTNVKLVSPDQSVAQAARMMQDLDVGLLPVAENDRLVGMISDRDIAIRAVGANKSPDTPVREVMSKEVLYCYETDEVEAAAQNMADIKVRRLPVLSQQKRLVGIVSLGDLAVIDGPDNAGEALCGISEPGGAHSQSRDGGRSPTLF